MNPSVRNRLCLIRQGFDSYSLVRVPLFDQPPASVHLGSGSIDFFVNI